MITYFNIHDLVKIKIRTKINSKIDIALKHFREFEEQFLDDKNIDIFIYDYSECPTFKNYDVISKYYYHSNNYLNILDEKICFNFIDKPLTVYCDSYIIPLNFLVELVLLRKNHSLIHSAAVQYNNKNYLFTAFGGIGKTTLVSAVIDKGGRLFGDDMVIVNEKEVLSYPLDFSVYPYHLGILKIKDKKMINELKKIKLLDNVFKSRISKLLIFIINLMRKRGYISVPPRRIFNFIEKGGYISVPPRRIFNSNCIAEKGQIGEIYYLSRVKNDLSKITIEKIDPIDLAKICTNILFQEWHQSMLILYVYSGVSKFSLDSIYNKISTLFRRIFTQHECHQIKIPNKLNNLIYQKQLMCDEDLFPR